MNRYGQAGPRAHAARILRATTVLLAATLAACTIQVVQRPPGSIPGHVPPTVAVHDHDHDAPNPPASESAREHAAPNSAVQGGKEHPAHPQWSRATEHEPAAVAMANPSHRGTPPGLNKDRDQSRAHREHPEHGQHAHGSHGPPDHDSHGNDVAMNDVQPHDSSSHGVDEHGHPGVAHGNSGGGHGHSSEQHGNSGAMHGQSGAEHGNSGADHGHSGSQHGHSSDTHGNSGAMHGQSGAEHGKSGADHGHSGSQQSSSDAHGMSGEQHGNSSGSHGRSSDTHGRASGTGQDVAQHGSGHKAPGGQHSAGPDQKLVMAAYSTMVGHYHHGATTRTATIGANYGASRVALKRMASFYNFQVAADARSGKKLNNLLATVRRLRTHHSDLRQARHIVTSAQALLRRAHQDDQRLAQYANRSSSALHTLQAQTNSYASFIHAAMTDMAAAQKSREAMDARIASGLKHVLDYYAYAAKLQANHHLRFKHGKPLLADTGESRELAKRKQVMSDAMQALAQLAQADS